MDLETRRLQLQAVLEAVLGSPNVYFQPAVNIEMQYPCIVYRRDAARTLFANNRPYRYAQRYSVTFIAREPNLPVVGALTELESCTYERFFVADNLNHDVFNLYF